MLSEYEAAKLSSDARREPYASPMNVCAVVTGTLAIIVAAAFADIPAPDAEAQAMPPRVSAAIAHSRQLHEERRARYEQARSAGARPLTKSYSASTAGGQDVADQQADVAGAGRQSPPAR